MFVLLSSELCLQWATFAGIRHTGSPIQRFIRSLFACFPGSLAWDRYFLCSWTPSSHLSPVSLSLVGTNLGFNLECGYGPWIGPHSLIYQHIYHIQISPLVFLPRTQAHWTLEATCAKGAWEDEISKTSRSTFVYIFFIGVFGKSNGFLACWNERSWSILYFLGFVFFIFSPIVLLVHVLVLCKRRPRFPLPIPPLFPLCMVSRCCWNGCPRLLKWSIATNATDGHAKDLLRPPKRSTVNTFYQVLPKF